MQFIEILFAVVLLKHAERKYSNQQLFKHNCIKLSIIQTIAGTIFGIRIRDQTPRPSYQSQYQPNLLDSLTGLKAGALRTGANALRFKVSIETHIYTRINSFTLPIYNTHLGCTYFIIEY